MKVHPILLAFALSFIACNLKSPNFVSERDVHIADKFNPTGIIY